MDSISQLLRLDGHGLFVWGAWLPCLAALAAEALLVRARLRRARLDARQRTAEASS